MPQRDCGFLLKNFMKSQHHYASVREDRFIAMDLVNPTVDFAKLAASFGMAAHHVERAADIAPAIVAGIASDTVNLIEIPVGVWSGGASRFGPASPSTRPRPCRARRAGACPETSCGRW